MLIVVVIIITTTTTTTQTSLEGQCSVLLSQANVLLLLLFLKEEQCFIWMDTRKPLNFYRRMQFDSPNQVVFSCTISEMEVLRPNPFSGGYADIIKVSKKVFKNFCLSFNSLAEEKTYKLRVRVV